MIKLKERFSKLKIANLPNAKETAKKYGHNELIKLYYNENKFGASPKIKEAIKIKSPNIYPEYKDQLLTSSLSKFFKLNDDYFYISNGSDAILDAIPTLFASKTNGQNIILPSLTFGRIETTAIVNDIKVKKVDLNEGKIDLEKTLEAIDKNTSIIYIVNPNMPTGKINSHDEMIKFLSKVPNHILVVIDEAYSEYAFGIEKTYKQNKEIIEKFDNVIITHTFSKLYGLASFRIGYMISRPYITELFKKAYQYLPVNKYSIQAANVALSDKKYYDNVILKTNEEKEKYYKLFDELNLKYYKSYGNFVFVFMDKNKDFENYLVSKYSVLIRSIQDFALRITIGTPQENELVFKALKEFYDKSK